MMLLDLDPNVVKPGWTPLLITVGLAVVMLLLYRSMRRQFRRVDVNFPEPRPATAGGTVPILPEPTEPAGDEPGAAVHDQAEDGRSPSP
jgi:hypothetical protein